MYMYMYMYMYSMCNVLSNRIIMQPRLQYNVSIHPLQLIHVILIIKEYNNMFIL